MSLASRRRLMIKSAKEEEEEDFPYKVNIRVDTSLVSDDVNMPYVLNNIKIEKQYYNIKSRYPFFMFVRAAGDYYLVLTSNTNLSAYIARYEGGVGMGRVGLGSEMRWWFTKDIVYEADLTDAVSNHPVYKVQRTIANQSNTPLAYWSRSITAPNPYLTIDNTDYQLPSMYDPHEFKYICVIYYTSVNVDYVLYSKNPFYAELMSDGEHYAIRYSNGNTTLRIKPNNTSFINPQIKYTINGIPYGGGGNYLNLRTTQTNYPILPIDANGNVID